MRRRKSSNFFRALWREIYGFENSMRNRYGEYEEFDRGMRDFARRYYGKNKKK